MTEPSQDPTMPSASTEVSTQTPLTPEQHESDSMHQAQEAQIRRLTDMYMEGSQRIKEIGASLLRDYKEFHRQHQRYVRLKSRLNLPSTASDLSTWSPEQLQGLHQLLEHETRRAKALANVYEGWKRYSEESFAGEAIGAQAIKVFGEWGELEGYAQTEASIAQVEVARKEATNRVEELMRLAAN